MPHAISESLYFGVGPIFAPYQPYIFTPLALYRALHFDGTWLVGMKFLHFYCRKTCILLYLYPEITMDYIYIKYRYFQLLFLKTNESLIVLANRSILAILQYNETHGNLVKLFC